MLKSLLVLAMLLVVTPCYGGKTVSTHAYQSGDYSDPQPVSTNHSPLDDSSYQNSNSCYSLPCRSISNLIKQNPDMSEIRLGKTTICICNYRIMYTTAACIPCKETDQVVESNNLLVEDDRAKLEQNKNKVLVLGKADEQGYNAENNEKYAGNDVFRKRLENPQMEPQKPAAKECLKRCAQKCSLSDGTIDSICFGGCEGEIVFIYYSSHSGMASIADCPY